MQHAKRIYRSLALPVPTFDHIKQFQRGYKEGFGIDLSNSQTIAIMLQQHKTLTAQEGHYDD